MDDFRVKVGFIKHPKTRKLKRLIGLRAVEIVLALWDFATSTESRRDGNLTGLDADSIADICDWDGEPEKLVKALLECGPAGEAGFIEGQPGKFRLHDWREINPYVATWKERSKRAKKAANKRWKKRDIPAQETHSDAPGMPDACATHAECNAPSPPPDPDPDPYHKGDSRKNGQSIETLERLQIEFYGLCRGDIPPSKLAEIGELLPLDATETRLIHQSHVKSWRGLFRFVSGLRDGHSWKDGPRRPQTAEERVAEVQEMLRKDGLIE